ncbi:hypothetical protein [Desulfonema magnum]|uniref:Uncharacterized protein n=1 Tax=Desulfonema magnum TaxID=45655 RepID=A0A975BI53_9BACT|nr:hypothetical protein [Desulfonema magnum]QTA85743.1 Uncharacterized protein dnm_017570 [Desulfonema magnum]
MKFAGTWHIVEMEMWDESYFNMEVQAYIKINKKGNGNFQFGLVTGYIDGEFIKEDEKLEFTWEGNDEMDTASGSGWVKMKEKDIIEGKIKFHMGDRSMFTAKRAK